MTRKFVAAAAVAVVAACGGVASAQAAGDIVFTDEYTDTVYLLDAPNSATGLISFAPDADFRLGGIINIGGTFYLANGPSVGTNTPAAQLLRLNNLFGGAATSTVLYSGDPLWNPTGLAYDASTNSLLAANDPGAINVPPTSTNGITALNLGTNVLTTLVTSDGNIGGPGATALTNPIRVTADANSGDFFVVDRNGGAYPGSSTIRSSVIYRMDSGGSLSVVVDLGDTGLTGLGLIEGARGAVSVGNSLFVTDDSTDAVYKITLDGFGNYAGISTLISGMGLLTPQEIVYNQYTDKLVFGDSGTNEIYQINLDGTGFETIMTGVNARGIAIVPTPAGVAMLGLGALAATRRRR